MKYIFSHKKSFYNRSGPADISWRDLSKKILQRRNFRLWKILILRARRQVVNPALSLYKDNIYM